MKQKRFFFSIIKSCVKYKKEKKCGQVVVGSREEGEKV